MASIPLAMLLLFLDIIFYQITTFNDGGNTDDIYSILHSGLKDLMVQLLQLTTQLFQLAAQLFQLAAQLLQSAGQSLQHVARQRRSTEASHPPSYSVSIFIYQVPLAHADVFETFKSLYSHPSSKLELPTHIVAN